MLGALGPKELQGPISVMWSFPCMPRPGGGGSTQPKPAGGAPTYRAAHGAASAAATALLLSLLLSLLHAVACCCSGSVCSVFLNSKAMLTPPRPRRPRGPQARRRKRRKRLLRIAFFTAGPPPNPNPSQKQRHCCLRSLPEVACFWAARLSLRKSPGILRKHCTGRILVLSTWTKRCSCRLHSATWTRSLPWRCWSRRRQGQGSKAVIWTRKPCKELRQQERQQRQQRDRERGRAGTPS